MIEKYKLLKKQMTTTHPTIFCTCFDTLEVVCVHLFAGYRFRHRLYPISGIHLREKIKQYI